MSLAVAVQSFREARAETPQFDLPQDASGNINSPPYLPSHYEWPAQVSHFSSFPCSTVSIPPKVLKKLYKRQDRFFRGLSCLKKYLSSEGNSLLKVINLLAAADSCPAGALYQRAEIYKLELQTKYQTSVLQQLKWQKMYESQ